MRTLVFSFIVLIFLLQATSAQTLKGGETTFEIFGIILDPFPPGPDGDGGDYTGTSQTLVLYGDEYYLNARWNARYSDGIERTIGVKCYLNCPTPGKDIDTNCIDYKNSTNYCSYEALTGYGFCTIINPEYLFRDQLNNITCKFYDPTMPEINYFPYPNRTFYPTYFEIFTTSEGSVTVGTPFILGLNIRSLSLIAGNFTSNVTVQENIGGLILAIVKNPIDQTSVLKYNQIGKINREITFLSAETTHLEVLTKSDVDPTVCFDDEECIDFGPEAKCIDGKCWKRNIVTINADRASLPEFGWIGLLQIMILSAVAILLIKKN